MSDKRYQIIRMNADTQYGRTAGQSVSADLTWEQALERMQGTNMNIDFTLASLKHHGAATFHDASGTECELRVHSR
jgi:hypothetical protein